MIRNIYNNEEIGSTRMVGVCFGHQLISYALNPGSVQKSEKG
jgi:GMP synthase-like glutamine amidotransferase